MPAPTAASPGQERLVKQISDSDQSCTGNTRHITQESRQQQGAGRRTEQETNFVAALHNHEEWHNYTLFKGSAGSGTSGQLGQGTAG